jgi:hypothetical protein
MILKEIPDDFIGIDIPASFTNKYLGEILVAAGPGVPAALTRV